MEVATSNYSRRREFFKRYGMSLLFSLPFILFFIFFTIVPIVMGIVISLFDYNSLKPEAMSFAGLENYISLFANQDVVFRYFWPALGKTILFAIVTVPFMIFIPLGLAILVNFEPPGYKIFRAILYLPCILSISTAGILFVTIFGVGDTGLFNAFFKTNIDFLNNQTLRWFVMLLLSIWWQTGTNFVIFSAAIKNVPKSLYEACESDGGGKWLSFTRVTFPNIKGSLALCLFNTLIGYLSLYGQPTVIRGDLTADSIDSPLMLLQNWLDDITYSKLTGKLTAVAIVFGLFVMAFSLAERKIMGLEKGGHKHENFYAAIEAIKK